MYLGTKTCSRIAQKGLFLSCWNGIKFSNNLLTKAGGTMNKNTNTKSNQQDQRLIKYFFNS